MSGLCPEEDTNTLFFVRVTRRIEGIGDGMEWQVKYETERTIDRCAAIMKCSVGTKTDSNSSLHPPSRMILLAMVVSGNSPMPRPVSLAGDNNESCCGCPGRMNRVCRALHLPFLSPASHNGRRCPFNPPASSSSSSTPPSSSTCCCWRFCSVRCAPHNFVIGIHSLLKYPPPPVLWPPGI